MIILALDLGTTIGWAIGSDVKHIVSGTMSFKNGRYEGGGMRYLRFQQWLNEMKQLQSFDQVAYEEVRRHMSTDAAHVYGGFLSTLTSECEKWEVPYSGIPVGTIKKFATGKGNASKEDMIAAAKAWGHNPIDDNEGDAIAILRCRLEGVG